MGRGRGRSRPRCERRHRPARHWPAGRPAWRCSSPTWLMPRATRTTRRRRSASSSRLCTARRRRRPCSRDGPGVAWALAHLDGRLLDLGDDDPNHAMDAALLALLDSSPVEDHDLVSGLVGLGVYSCERLPRPSARAALERIVTQLGLLAEEDGAGVRWFTAPHRLAPDPRRLSPAGHWDLGMAHGAAGVVAFLAHARAAGAGGPAVDDLLERAAGWLTGQRLPPESPSRYAPWIAPGQSPRPARTAWCYGAPGVAAALLAAGRRDDAVEVARAAAGRPVDDCGVVDAGLCHGAAGLLHVFNRLHQATGDGLLADAARGWFEPALVLPVPEDGFLEGRAGVGLALLAACTDIEPAWDRILLLSGRRPGRGDIIARRPPSAVGVLRAAHAAPAVRGVRAIGERSRRTGPGRAARRRRCPVPRLAHARRCPRRPAGGRGRAQAGRLPHEGRHPVHALRPVRRVHGRDDRRDHPPGAVRPDRPPPPHPARQRLPVRPRERLGGRPRHAARAPVAPELQPLPGRGPLALRRSPGGRDAALVPPGRGRGQRRPDGGPHHRPGGSDGRRAAPPCWWTATSTRPRRPPSWAS